MSDDIDYTKFIWQASWKGHKALVKMGSKLPNWIYEGGSSVRWKIISKPEVKS